MKKEDLMFFMKSRDINFILQDKDGCFIRSSYKNKNCHSLNLDLVFMHKYDYKNQFFINNYIVEDVEIRFKEDIDKTKDNNLKYFMKSNDVESIVNGTNEFDLFDYKNSNYKSINFLDFLCFHKDDVLKDVNVVYFDGKNKKHPLEEVELIFKNRINVFRK